MSKKLQVIETSRELIKNEHFKNRNRKSEKLFTRLRSLPFDLVLIMILRKSAKSLQCIVNEAMSGLGLAETSASAYSQARYKLKHSAFIELNQKAIVNIVYQDDDFATFWGKRILAIDGSKIRLPNTPEIVQTFSTMAYSQGEGSDVQGEHPFALGSILYDVLNRVALDATLDKANAYEVDLAIAHLAHTQCHDLILMDRNYPSYRMLASLQHYERNFATSAPCGYSLLCGLI